MELPCHKTQVQVKVVCTSLAVFYSWEKRDANFAREAIISLLYAFCRKIKQIKSTYNDTVLPLPNFTRFQTKTSSDRNSFLVTRNPSSQYIVLITISDDPGTARSNASPLGKGGDEELIISPSGPSFCNIVESSGLVLSTFNLNPSNPSALRTVQRVVMMEVATPPRVATLTRDTSVPVTGRAAESMSMVCVAGPTILSGAGMASVMPKI